MPRWCTLGGRQAAAPGRRGLGVGVRVEVGVGLGWGWGLVEGSGLGAGCRLGLGLASKAGGEKTGRGHWRERPAVVLERGGQVGEAEQERRAEGARGDGVT